MWSQNSQSAPDSKLSSPCNRVQSPLSLFALGLDLCPSKLQIIISHSIAISGCIGRAVLLASGVSGSAERADS